MPEIKKTDVRPVSNYMAADYDSFLTAMQDLIPYWLPEWKDYESEADFGNVLLQLFAHMGDILSYHQERVGNESFLGTAQSRRSIIHHLRLIGYRLSTAAPASTTLTLSVPANCEEILTIRKGDAFATKSQQDKPSVRFEYTRDEDLVIECAPLKVDQGTNQKHFYGIPVEEGRLIKDVILGISDGAPNQQFTLAHPRMILKSRDRAQQIHKDIILLTKLSDQIEEWVLQESLAFSRAQQQDYIVEIDENDQATVLFGNGEFGAIPPAGAEITATYRSGGGRQGNVGIDSIETIIEAPQLALADASITNSEAATGGAERESIDHAVQHAPEVFRSLRRAVTAEDYRALALDFKGVGKVRAEATNWNMVNLFVAPEGGGYLSDVLQANLLAYFEGKRLLSTIIEVKDVTYVKIYVTATIGVEKYYPVAEITEKVSKAGSDLLAFDNVDFGQTLYLSKFFEAFEAIHGVAFVNITEFRREDQAKGSVDPQGRLILEPSEIPTIPDEANYGRGIRVIVE